ncbi:MAG TPA: thioesterase [Desulfotomaculum sp.]|nr:MAG: Putative thioesterase [Desulfotomaculum sp. 46_80]HAG11470.1 thioesterase [Desulfotomaculum sp.]HBY03087.1 thioesterase [Desulfotomaculum sp.]
MKSTLQAGLYYEFKFTVPENKTVPYLYPESEELQVMPKVLATGYMVGLFEWACIKALKPHLDWPNEQTVGTDLKLSHVAATPPGLTVTVKIRLEKIEGKRLFFHVEGHDGIDLISEGTHERFIIDAAKFIGKVNKKNNAPQKPDTEIEN